MNNKYIIFYLIVVNMITFIAFMRDKNKAKKNKWRIPEKTLMGLVIIGGAIGGFAGMKVFHHKTRKPLFRYGIPCVIIVEVLILIWFYML